MLKTIISELEKLIYALDVDNRDGELFLCWTKKKIKLHFRKSLNKFFPNKGEIYYVNLGKNISTEINKNRPCVVRSVKKHNAGGNIVVLPLKTFHNIVKSGHAILVEPSVLNGLIKKSLITLTNIRSVSKNRFGGKIGVLEDEYISIVDYKLQHIFGFKKTLNCLDPEFDAPNSLGNKNVSSC